MSALYLPKKKVNILLLENVHPIAKEIFYKHGYHNVNILPSSLNEIDLKEALHNTHILGIRSRTQITQSLLPQNTSLLAIGCFCIGTNQVDLNAYAQAGIPVFNAPFSNTRSVAELILGEIILLLRQIPKKNRLLHQKKWAKSAQDCHETRGKILGIIGYGRIGTQLGLLAESLGMRVIFYDIETKLSLGNTVQYSSLSELLKDSDVISLNVPESPNTYHMISHHELSLMKESAVLINISRGNVIDIEALNQALIQGKLLGIGLDVYPVEPKSNNEPFEHEIYDFENSILTPHIGGSTIEAQKNIAHEVSHKLIQLLETGSTFSAVNFPSIHISKLNSTTRIIHIHQNKPGVLRQLNKIFADENINIDSQYLQTYNEIGYVVMDLNQVLSQSASTSILAMKETITLRIIDSSTFNQNKT